MRTNDALELAIGVLADLEGEAEHTSREERAEAIALLRQLQQPREVSVVVYTFEDGDHDVVLVGGYPAVLEEYDEGTEEDKPVTIHNREELAAWAERVYDDSGVEIFDGQTVCGPEED